MCVVVIVVLTIGRMVSSMMELALDEEDSLRLINGGETSLPMVLGGVDLGG